jgi:hypothetical protein
MQLFATPQEATTSDDYYTPAWLFEDMGVEFDMDVASPPGGVPWIPAKRFLTMADDGLSTPWEGFVWCNPPYSKPAPWLDRMTEHGDGIILVPADLSSSAYYRAFENAGWLHVPRGRIQFVNGGATPFTTVLIGFGDKAGDALGRLPGCTRQLL